MKFSELRLRTKILLSVCGPLVLAIFIGIVSMVNINAILKTDKWVDFTHRVMNSSEQLIRSAVDMETGMRGYLLSGEETFLEPYYAGEKKTFEIIGHLKKQVNHNRLQMDRLEKAETILREWQKNVTVTNINLRKEIGVSKTMDDMAALIKKAEGKAYFDQFRKVMADFITEEEVLLKSRLTQSDSTVTNTRVVIIFSMVITLVLGLALGLLVTSDIQKQVGGEPAHISGIARKVADGELDIDFEDRKLTGIYASLEEMVRSIKDIASDIRGVVGRVVLGYLNARGNVMTYHGGWRDLVSGINNALDSVVTHIDQIPSPFMIVDRNYNILSVNRVCSEWIGMDHAEMIGRRCYEIFQTSLCNTGECTCYKAFQSGVTEQNPASLTAGGKEMFVSSTGVPVKDDSGKVVAVLEVLDDQTEMRREDWIKSGQNELSIKMSGELEPKRLAQNVINFVAGYIDAQVGVFYLAGDNETLQLVASYAYKKRSTNDSRLKFGESMIGQAALEKKSLLFTEVPEDHVSIDINSGMGNSVPKSIFVFPLVAENEILGVIGLGSTRVFNEKEMEMLERVSEMISVNLNSANARVRLNELLEETQAQSEELQAQQEELKATNEALEQQAEELKASEESLQAQQEELRASNEELTEKTELLERQKQEVAKSNEELEHSREEMRQKANQLSQATKYKTEFLANMSHELRTPLNSLLLLSKNLTKNKDGNLSEKQVKDAEIIYKSGTDLLDLINGILDLSKIESGKMTVAVDRVSFKNVADNITNLFQQILEENHLKFNVNIDIPGREEIFTDQQKLEQILKNLMSNAVKFTEEGSISLSFRRPEKTTLFKTVRLNPETAVAITVKDTGRGIPDEKQNEIFEAFKQEDGTIVRRYGGTGLGLSICREFAGMLGGEIQLESKEGEGAAFTVYIPEDVRDTFSAGDLGVSFRELAGDYAGRSEPYIPQKETEKPVDSVYGLPGIEDDRETIQKDDQVVLVIEDDLNFAGILYNACQEKGLKAIHAPDGETGMKLLENYQVNAVLLDIKLPGINGWGVLKKLKQNINTRHIPVHMMSVDDNPYNILQRGAIGFLKKPVSETDLNTAFDRITEVLSKGVRKLLVVEDNREVIESLCSAFETIDVSIDTATTGKEALEKIRREKHECIILDLGLPDLSGQELLKQIEMIDASYNPAVIIHTARDLSDEECFELYRYASSMVSKSPRSMERLVDEVALFLHTVVEKMPGPARKAISRLHEDSNVLSDKKIMIVDDDVRNIYSVITTLEDYDMEFVKAKDGRQALELLKKNPDIDLILMDIMMPVMDGYEAIKRIRKMQGYEKIPILALTAKGMKKDREQTFEAGATDYLMKPVDPDKLLSTIRVWLHT